ncbi:palmitoyltransferase for Vac8p [Neophaeococcomyces mojaviensis]|uniref:Palmitoyltransferase for Vac8p n=1 Tax=Neophaeococcomyces mojaviensis TaxID=3383035 RepID=A0ACC3AJQ2_9EURO|nr:palmitoyltransferase for Vac8p [Knufia sp. JES_112]
MAQSRSSSPSPPPTRLQRKFRPCARKVERGCCLVATYFPLAFVYGLTTWAVSVEASLAFRTTESTTSVPLSRRCLSFLGVAMYIMLNTCYTVAVFTNPGSPLQDSTKNTRGGKYSVLPTSEPSFDMRGIDTITVSSTGGARFCKKCQVLKPDRTHHCSTCKRCVLKMDHHCPWLSTCLGLHNYKAFILFLIYTSLFCWVCFVSTAYWVWTEIFSSRQYLSEFAPVQVIILTVLSGIIGLVITGFTSWHVYLCFRGQTTIECLEKTRYLAGVRRRVEQVRQDQHQAQHNRNRSEGGITETIQRAGGQILEFHANAVPGASRYEEGEEHTSPAPSVYTPPRSSQYSDFPSRNDESPAQQALRKNYSSYERDREHERYEDYLDDKETSKMPNAFDLGWRKNLAHLFGPNPWLWFLPVCNTTGDGWQWEVSQKWLTASEEAARRREQRLQLARENRQAPVSYCPSPRGGAGRHYQDGVEGSYDNNPGAHGEGAMSMQTFRSGRRQRQDFDRAGENGEVGSFEVSDSGNSGSENESSRPTWKQR